MSVLIKGKALPKCCGDCWLARCVAYSDYCRVLSVNINVIDPTYKHPNYPLVEIPEPHEGHWIRTDCGLDVECKCSVCGYKDFVSPHDILVQKKLLSELRSKNERRTE